jgi:hypothetical protein
MYGLPQGFSFASGKTEKICLTKQLEYPLVRGGTMEPDAVGNAKVASQLLELWELRSVADNVEGNVRECTCEYWERPQHDRGCFRFELSTYDDQARSFWRQDSRDTCSREVGFRHCGSEDPSDRRVTPRRRPIGISGCKDDVSSAGNALQKCALQPPEKSSLGPRIHRPNEKTLSHRKTNQQPESADRRGE